MKIKYECIDAGRQGCPCTLLEAGKCIECTRINEGNCDNCNWQGSCIYTLYTQNDNAVEIPSRDTMIVKIISKREYFNNLVVFSMKADYGFCQRASRPGAYIFARGKDEEQWFDTPISILKVDLGECIIHIAINIDGPKSLKLSQCEDYLVIRGVYYNGILGINNLSEDKDKTVVFAKGIAIAPLRNMLDGGYIWGKYLRNLKLYIDLDKIGFDFLKTFFSDIPVDKLKIVDMRESIGKILCQNDLSQSNVLALVSPYYVHIIEEACGQEVVKPNPGKFCCGEGICGACSFDNDEGETVHLCKARS